MHKIINLRRSEFGAFCIPPFVGYILAHIGDFEYPKAINAIAATLQISSSAIDKFIQQLVDNADHKEFQFSEKQSIVFPTALLKHYSQKPHTLVHEDKSFDGLGDFVIKRPSVPINANLMVTTNCTTDCIYCYANRKLSPALSTEKILNLLKELHDQGTINVTLTGGDIFAHPDWRIILKCVRDYGYKPFLSTKTPLSFEQVKYLRDLGYDEIQFSLDSIALETLKVLIGAKDGYLDKVTSFLNHSSHLRLNVLVRSVLSKLNSSKESVSSLYAYLSGFDCVKEWIMTPAFFSKYKENEYKSLEVTNEDLIWIYEFTRKSDLAFKIGLNKISLVHDKIRS